MVTVPFVPISMRNELGCLNHMRISSLLPPGVPRLPDRIVRGAGDEQSDQHDREQEVDEGQSTREDVVALMGPPSGEANCPSVLDDYKTRWHDLRVTGPRRFNPAWDLVFELRNMLTVSEAIARSKLALVSAPSAVPHGFPCLMITQPPSGNSAARPSAATRPSATGRSEPTARRRISG